MSTPSTEKTRAAPTIPAKRSTRARRGRQEGSVAFHAGKQLWQARRTLKAGEPGYIAGRQTQRSAWGPTKEAALAKLAELGAPPTVAPNAGAFARAVERWREHAKASNRFRRNTAEYYEAHLRKHVLSDLGTVPLAKLDAKRIERTLAAVDSLPSRRGAYLAIRSVLEVAVADGTLSSNPAAKVRKPKQSKGDAATAEHQVRAWTLEESRAFLSAAEAHSPWAYAVYSVFLGAGLRRGELFALRRRDFDPKTGALRVTRTLTEVASKGAADSVFSFGPPKTQAGVRTVALPPFAADAVRAHLAALPKDGSADPLLFADRLGGPMRKRNFDRRIHSALIAKAGVPDLTPHELRHTHATLLLAAGESVRLVATRLGHADPKVLLQVYAHVLPSHDAEAASRFGRLLSTAE